jgi:hypothetical protein
MKDTGIKRYTARELAQLAPGPGQGVMEAYVYDRRPDHPHDLFELTNFKHLTRELLSGQDYETLDALVTALVRTMYAFDYNFEQKDWHVAIAAKSGIIVGAAIVGRVDTDTDETWEGKKVEALRNMLHNRMSSAYLAVITNFTIGDAEAAFLRSEDWDKWSKMGEKRPFSLIVAPCFEPGVEKALLRLDRKTKLLQNENLAYADGDSVMRTRRIRELRGVFLEQVDDGTPIELVDEEIRQWGRPIDETGSQRSDIVFAWALATASPDTTIAIVAKGVLRALSAHAPDTLFATEQACHMLRMQPLNNAVACYSTPQSAPFPGPILWNRGVRTIVGMKGSRHDESVEAFIADPHDIAIGIGVVRSEVMTLVWLPHR